MLPPGSPVERCLFWVAREASPTIRAVMKRVPEPAIEHVREGLALARHVANIAGRSARLAELLRPEEVRPFEPVYLGRYNMGFHSAPHEIVRSAMIEAGARLLSIREVLDRVAVLHVNDETGAATQDPITQRWIRDGELEFRTIEPTAPGVFTLEIPDAPLLALALFSPGAGLDLAPPRGGEVLALTLRREEPVEIVPAAAEISWSAADLAAAVTVVAEVYATPIAYRLHGASIELALGARAERGMLAAELEVRRDGVVAKSASEWIAAPASFDRARWTALVRGIRTAVAALDDLERLTPADLLPTDLLAAPELDDDDDFARRAFDLLPIARARAPIEAGPVLARHGFDELEAGHVADLWLLLPQTILSHRVENLRWASVAAAAKRLAANDATKPLVEIAVEEWTTAMRRARASALAIVPVHERMDALLRDTLGLRRTLAARRRALGQRSID